MSRGKDAPLGVLSGKRPAPSSGATRHLPPTGGRLQQYRELCSSPGNGLALSVTFGDTSPKGRGSGETIHFVLLSGSLPPCQGLSLLESCQGLSALTERASPLSTAPLFSSTTPPVKTQCRAVRRPPGIALLYINNSSADDTQSKAARILNRHAVVRLPAVPCPQTSAPQ